MSRLFCLMPNVWENKQLIDKFGNDIAYHIVHLNKGNDLTKTPNGKESLLYRDLQNIYGYTIALEAKSAFYTTDFRNKFGNWVDDKAKTDIKLDENGEPKLTDFLSLMQKTNIVGDKWRYASNDKLQPITELSAYHSAKSNYTPMLEKLSKQFNIPWKEGDTDGHPSVYIDGMVVVDFTKITPDAPFHEFMHPVILLMEASNPKSLDRLVRQAMGDKAIVAKVDARYGNIKGTREYRMELVATAVGEYAVQALKAKEQNGILAAIREFFDDVFKAFKMLFVKDSKMTIEQLSSMSLREIGFMMGVKPPQLSQTSAQEFYNSIDPKNGNSVVKEVSNRAMVDYYRELLGWENIEYVRMPSMADEQTTNYKIRIFNPLSTKGQKFYRRANETKIEKTDNKFFDALILAVNEVANSKEEELKASLSNQQKRAKRLEVRYLNSLVEEIASFKNLDQALHVMRSEIGKMNLKLAKPQSLEEISSDLKLLNSFKTIIEHYTIDNTSPEMYNDIKTVNTASGGLYEKFKIKYTEQFKAEYLSKGGYESVANSLTDSVRDINELSLQTIGSSFGQNPIEQAVDHIIRMNAHEMNENRRKFTTELNRKLEALGSSDITWMVDGDMIMTKSNPEFFNKVNEIRDKIKKTDNDTREMRKQARELHKEIMNLQAAGDIMGSINKEVELKKLNEQIRNIRLTGASWSSYHKFMMQYFDYVMDEDKVSHFQDDMEVMKEMYYEEDANGNPVLNKEKYQKAIENYSPEKFADFINGDIKYANQGWKYFKMVPKESAKSTILNPKYTALSDNQREFYDFFMDKFAEASISLKDTSLSMNDDLSHDDLVNEFISIPTDQAEKAGYLESAKRWLGDLVATPEGAEELGIHGVFTGVNRKGIKYRPASTFLKQGIALREQNIISAFEKFYDAGMTYKYKNQVAALLESGKEIAATLKKMDIDADGNIKTNIMGDPALISGKTKISKRIEHIIENYLTEDVYEDMFGNIKIKDKVITGERIIDLINDFTRYRQLGLNPFSGLSNLAMGAVNNWSYSKREEFFDDDNLRKAYFRLKNNTLRYVTANKVGNTDISHKLKLLADVLGVSQNLLEKKYGNILDKAFTFQESGEFVNQMASALAVMDNKKTIEALLGPGKKLLDRTGAEREVLDLYKVDGDQLVLDNEVFDLEALGINNTKMFNMAQAIMKINKEIHGDYDQLNKMFLKRNALGRAVATFRTWLPQAVMQRFGGERKDYQLSAFYNQDISRKGRYVSVVDLYKKEGFVKSSLNIMGSLATGFVPFIKGKISEDLNITDLDKSNINQTLTELRLILGLMLATAFMGKVADDDELEEGAMVSTFNFFYNMTGRLENELATFYVPTSSYKIFKDIVPAFDTMEQFGDVLSALNNKVFYPEDDIYERGFRKGTSKLSKEFQLLLPITKQAQNIWSTLNVQYEKTAYNR